MTSVLASRPGRTSFLMIQLAVARAGVGGLVLALLAGISLDAAEATRAPANLAELRQQLAAHVSAERFSGAMWGIQVVSLETGATLFETNAHRLLKPASNNKLFTGALVLDRFGPARRIRTSFLAAGSPSDTGTVKGDVVVVGRGDPSFAARFHGSDYTKSLVPLVDALHNAGVRQIEGDLVGDESFFKGPPFGASWTWDDLQYYYGAQVSALSAEDNTLDLQFKPGPSPGSPCLIVTKPATDHVRFENLAVTGTNGGPRRIDLYRAPGSAEVRVTGTLPAGDQGLTGAVAVPDPALLFLRLLRAELKQRGITVSGRLRVVDWRGRERQPSGTNNLVELAGVESRPLGELVMRMMKPSQNLYAQLLFLQAGESMRKAGDRVSLSEDLGQAALRAFLRKVGVADGEVLLEEGSGLSRSALVTPAAIVALLRHMDRHEHAAAFRESLPVAGVDGTLRLRMKGTPAAGQLQAKTGTLRYVNALSGYTATAAGERLAFSILLNAYRPPAAGSGRNEVDTVAVMLTSLAARSDAP